LRAALLGIGLGLIGCSREWALYGEEVELPGLQSRALSVSDGVSQKTGEVIVAGEIGEVCSIGCWFYLIDDEEMLFVRRHKRTNLTVPTDSSGRDAVVKGVLKGEGETLELEATSVGILE
jgi:hypothetical protein